MKRTCEVKPFHLGDVLSVTTGILVAPGGISSIYSILCFLTGEPCLSTHQLPRALDACKPYLLERHPEILSYHDDLREASTALVWGADAAERWLIDAAARFCSTARPAPYLDLEPLPPETWLHIDPIKEALAMFRGDRVVVLAEQEAEG